MKTKRPYMTYNREKKTPVFLQALYTALAICLLCSGCRRIEHGQVPHPAPSVYYWRTTWKLSLAERDFLHVHHIGKIYLRYFDVALREGEPCPVGTLTFKDSMPQDVEIIPTVFIDERCLHGKTDGLAARIVERICRMTETHDIPYVHEVQLDCDYTERSRETYYRMLHEARAELQARGLRLSVTIRLHQLSMPPPEADYGVLMMYNTGDFRQLNGRNPILDLRDAAPYLPRLKDYRLPLCAAYPAYEWTLLFSQDTFRTILYGADVNDSTLYRPAGEDTFSVTAARDVYYGDNVVHLVPGETVVRHRCSAHDILQVKKALANVRPDIHSQIIIYHLDETNIKHYTPAEYEAFYHP